MSSHRSEPNPDQTPSSAMALALVQTLAEAFEAAPDAATKARLFDIHGRRAAAIMQPQTRSR